MNSFLDQANQIIWGPPLLILFCFTGIFLTVRLRAVQFRFLWLSHKLAFMKAEGAVKGEITQFQSLMAALAGTIGIGSIVGVATAIAIGGCGSIFWMWVAGFLGMAIKYGEALLALKFRNVEGKTVAGGPMYYIHQGMGRRWLAFVFAGFGAVTALSTGNMVQANAVSAAMMHLWSIPSVCTGLILLVVVAVPLLGGIKSIGKLVAVLVPAMALMYFLVCLGLCATHVSILSEGFVQIFREAFKGPSAAGGFIGVGVMEVIQLGFSRGVFSSEAGLGTSSIVAAAAKSDHPAKQALVSMSSVFITTGIVCTMTGLVIISSGVTGGDGAQLAFQAFGKLMPYGDLFISAILIPFAYSTILGWSYCGEKCVEYLFGPKSIRVYRVLFILLSFVGAVMSLKTVWSFANLLNGLMCFPNLIAIIYLSHHILLQTEHFEKEYIEATI